LIPNKVKMIFSAGIHEVSYPTDVRALFLRVTGFYAYKECHKTESLPNHTASKEREQLGD
jgi:hypothetical protein